MALTDVSILTEKGQWSNEYKQYLYENFEVWAVWAMFRAIPDVDAY